MLPLGYIDNLGADVSRRSALKQQRGSPLYVRSRPTASSDDSGILPLQLDVTDEAQWSGGLARIESRFGGLNILVNNAAILLRALITSRGPANGQAR